MQGSEFRKYITEGNLEAIKHVNDSLVLNETDADENSSLMLALMNGHTHIAEHLLTLNVKLITVNSAGLNALQIAKQNDACRRKSHLLNKIKAKIYEEASSSDLFGEVDLNANDEIVGNVALLAKRLQSLKLQETHVPPPVAPSNKKYMFNRTKQEQYLQLKNTVAELLKNPPAIQLQPYQLEYPIYRFTLSLPPEFYFKIGEKVITKLILLQEIHIIGIIKNNYSSRLVVQFESGESKVIPLFSVFLPNHLVPEAGNRVYKVKDLMNDLGAIVDLTQADIHDRKILAWSQKPHGHFYEATNDVKEYYKHLHRHVAKRTASCVEEKALNQTIDLISVGCGDGRELLVAQTELKAAGFKVNQTVGIDINADNFPKSPIGTPPIQFKAGDVMNLDEMFANCNLDPTSFKVVYLLGVLTARVMPGTYSALAVIQQTRMMNKLFVGGFTTLLLNKSTLRAVGFQVDLTQTGKEFYNTNIKIEHELDPHHIFELNWMTSQERRAYLLRRGKNRSSSGQFTCLDLSFSANPLCDLQLFTPEALQAIKQIDISWSYLKGDEVTTFFKTLGELKMNKLLVLVSKHQKNFEKIMEEAPKWPNIEMINRMDSANENEIPVFKPNKAKEWGLYAKLPNENLSNKLKLG